MKLYVDLGKNSYLIYIENGIMDDAAEHIAKVFSGKKIMLISDDNGGRISGQVADHSSSQGDYQIASGHSGFEQSSIDDGERAGADGLMIEVHNNPECALCDGAQSLKPKKYEELIRQVSGIAKLHFHFRRP